MYNRVGAAESLNHSLEAVDDGSEGSIGLSSKTNSGALDTIVECLVSWNADIVVECLVCVVGGGLDVADELVSLYMEGVRELGLCDVETCISRTS